MGDLRISLLYMVCKTRGKGQIEILFGRNLRHTLRNWELLQGQTHKNMLYVDDVHMNCLWLLILDHSAKALNGYVLMSHNTGWTTSQNLHWKWEGVCKRASVVIILMGSLLALKEQRLEMLDLLQCIGQSCTMDICWDPWLWMSNEELVIKCLMSLIVWGLLTYLNSFLLPLSLYLCPALLGMSWTSTQRLLGRSFFSFSSE